MRMMAKFEEEASRKGFRIQELEEKLTYFNSKENELRMKVQEINDLNFRIRQLEE